MADKIDKRIGIVYKIGAVFMICAVYLLFINYMDLALQSYIRPSYRSIYVLLTHKKGNAYVASFFIIAYGLRIVCGYILDKIDLSYVYSIISIIFVAIASIYYKNQNVFMLYLVACASALYFSAYYYKLTKNKKYSVMKTSFTLLYPFVGMIIAYTLSSEALNLRGKKVRDGLVTVFNREMVFKGALSVIIIGLIVILFIMFIYIVIRLIMKMTKDDQNLLVEKPINNVEKENKNIKPIYKIICIITSLVSMSYVFHFFILMTYTSKMTAFYPIMICAPVIMIITGSIYDRRSNVMLLIVSIIFMLFVDSYSIIIIRIFKAPALSIPQMIAGVLSLAVFVIFIGFIPLFVSKYIRFVGDKHVGLAIGTISAIVGMFLALMYVYNFEHIMNKDIAYQSVFVISALISFVLYKVLDEKN